MAGSGNSLRVAIVEDDVLVRRAMSRLLSSLGFTVAPFASAEELLSSVSRDSVDCLIIDVHLPRLSGIQLFDALKRRAWTTPVIFMTADSEAARGADMVRTGAPCLVKPCGDKELLAAINRLTSDSR